MQNEIENNDLWRRGVDFLENADEHSVTVFRIKGPENNAVISPEFCIMGFPSSEDPEGNVNYLFDVKGDRPGFHAKLRYILSEYNEEVLEKDGQDPLFWKIAVKDAFESNKPLFVMTFAGKGETEQIYVATVKGVTLQKALKNFVHYASAHLFGFDLKIPE
jgi:hypothetical protein